MRMMMKVGFPTDKANEAFRNGTFMKTMESFLASMKPEAVYFAEDNGERTGYIIFDMQDSSQLPAVAEPMFLAFNAKITVRPVMTPADLAQAVPAIQASVQAYGGTQ
jgi:hypothetical protein